MLIPDRRDGAYVEALPRDTGRLHISEMTHDPDKARNALNLTGEADAAVREMPHPSWGSRHRV